MTLPAVFVIVGSASQASDVIAGVNDNSGGCKLGSNSISQEKI
jgi:hypothetical protein